MKSKFYFVRHSGGLNVGETIYHVWVGTSLREKAKQKLVEIFCRENDLPFVPWSLAVDSLIEQQMAKYKADGCKGRYPYRTASITISKLYQLIIEDSFERFEADNLPSKFEIYINHYNDPEYVARENKKNRDTTCLPHHALNLSVSDCTVASI